MSYESDLTSIWKGGCAMDDWYGKAVALKEDANAARTHSKLVYTAEEVFNRASNTLTSAAFYDENDYARALIDYEGSTMLPSATLYDESDVQALADYEDLTMLPSATLYGENEVAEALIDDEDLTTRNQRELRASMDKPLPALPELDNTYYDYMFPEASYDQQNDDGDEGQLVGIEEDSGTLMVDPFSPSEYSSVYDAPSPSTADEDDLPSTPTNSVPDRVHFGFDGNIIKQETPTNPTFPVVDVPVPASPVYSPVSSPTSIAPNYAVANSTSSAFASLLPVYSPLPSPVSFAPVYSVGKNIATVPFFDDQETEITDATAGFYGGFAVEDSPSPYHAPLIDEDAGFGDIRDGCERFPEQWTDSDTQAKLVAPYKLSGLQIFSEELELPDDKSTKPLLKPKSQIAKAAKTCDMGFGQIHRATYTPQITTLSGFSDVVIAKLNGNKRSASDSITTYEDFDDSDYEDDEENEAEVFQPVKKARLSDDATMDAEVIYAPMPAHLSVRPDLKHKSSARSITQSLLANHVDFSSVTDGYPGQFKALLPPTKLLHSKFMSAGRPNEVTFGDEGHANGVFHHTRFQGGGNSQYNKYSLDYTTNSAVPCVDGTLGRLLKLADANHDAAAETDRTVKQEALRRESHFECSVARLENVPVGEYRYYQGHSSVEEYSRGGMCVCWKECFCTDMCTEYADMLCPCGKYLEFEV